MTSTITLAWLAGLLEGEASFGVRKWKDSRKKPSPVIQLSMCDRDIVERVAKVWGKALYGPYGRVSRPLSAPVWKTDLANGDAIAMMMTLYSFMGSRRRTRIRQIIKSWRSPNVLDYLSKGGHIA